MENFFIAKYYSFSRQDRIIKLRLATNIDGYPLRLALLIKQAYSNGADLILSC